MVIFNDASHVSPYHQQRWIGFRNNAAQEVPPYGIMEITGAVLLENLDVLLTTTRPTANALGPGCIAINGPSKVAAGGFGECVLSFPAMVAYDSGTTPAFGEWWGTQSGSFLLFKNHGTIQLTSVTAVTPDRAYCISIGDVMRCRLTADVSSATSVVANIVDKSKTETAITFTLHNPIEIFDEAEDDGYAFAQWMADGCRWEQMQGTCPA